MAIRRNGILNFASNSNLKNQRALVDAIVAAIIKGVPVAPANQNAARKVSARISAAPVANAIAKRANSNKLVKTFTADQLAMAIVLAIRRGVVPIAVTEKLIKVVTPDAEKNSRVIAEIMIDAITHKEPLETRIANATNQNVNPIVKLFKRALAFFRPGTRANNNINNSVVRQIARAASIAELAALLSGPLSEINMKRVIAAIVAALRAPGRSAKDKLVRLGDAARDLAGLLPKFPKIREELAIQFRRAEANAARERFSWPGPGRPPGNNGQRPGASFWPGPGRNNGRSRGVPFWPEPQRRNNGLTRRYAPPPLQRRNNNNMARRYAPPPGPMGPFGPGSPPPRRNNVPTWPEPSPKPKTGSSWWPFGGGGNAAPNTGNLPTNQSKAIENAGGVNKALETIAAVPGGAPEVAKAAADLNEMNGNRRQANELKGTSPVAMNAVERLGGHRNAAYALEGLNNLSRKTPLRRKPATRRRKPKNPRLNELNAVIRAVKKRRLMSLVANKMLGRKVTNNDDDHLKKYYAKVIKANILRTPLSAIVRQAARRAKK